MSGLDLDRLPQPLPRACARLAAALRTILGDELVALWTYGAATFPDPPRRLDVDTHAVLARQPTPDDRGRIEAAHAALASELQVDWDSWYVLEAEASDAGLPRHVLHPTGVDTAWALHRAHWLAGRYALVHGKPPESLVAAPSWSELEEGLAYELHFMEQYVAEGRDDVVHASFAIWNGCRVLYSVETREVVVSKRHAAAWALAHLPASWHEAIGAAGQAYDSSPRTGDAQVLRTAMAPFLQYVRARSRLPPLRSPRG